VVIDVDPSTPPPVVQPAVIASTAPAAPPARDATTALTRRKVSSKASLVASPPSTQPPASPQGELELLRKAQDALNRSPASALPLLAEHEATYPAGIFVQEREMLRIEAELALGHRKPALARAASFAQRFAHSTYHARIEALLQSSDTHKVEELSPPDGTQ
jgi:hypothetical protein